MILSIPNKFQDVLVRYQRQPLIKLYGSGLLMWCLFRQWPYKVQESKFNVKRCIVNLITWVSIGANQLAETTTYAMGYDHCWLFSEFINWLSTLVRIGHQSHICLSQSNRQYCHDYLSHYQQYPDPPATSATDRPQGTLLNGLHRSHFYCADHWVALKMRGFDFQFCYNWW